MSRLNYFQTRPKVFPIDAAKYLHRIGMVGPVAQDLKALKKLHRAHLLSIPFENLDIHYGKKITLNVKTIYEKIILNHRGGFCYELNLLFFHLLIRIGFNAFLAQARLIKQGRLTPEFDHMIVLVRIDGETFLCDVGFGNHFTEPKKLEQNIPQLDYTSYYLFDRNPDNHWILKKSKDGSVYSSIYQFAEHPCEVIEFMNQCTFHQESPDSVFTQQKLITQLFKEGRITLTDRKLKLMQYGSLEEKPVLNEDQFLSILEQHFGIDVQKLLRQEFN